MSVTQVNRCRSCVHWKLPSERDSHVATHICGPRDPDTFKPMVLPFEVRICKHPNLLFHERPVENPGFAIADGSEYWAQIFTTEEFGCVMHEAAP